MYHYVTDKEFLKHMRGTCSGLVNQLVQAINKDSVMKVEAHLIGSGAKNLITQNADLPVDLDYNLQIIRSKLTNGREIKEYVRKQFNVVLRKNDWRDCQDSTSVFTAERRGGKTKFSMDLAITRLMNGHWERLMHEKTGFTSLDRHYWNQVPDSGQLEEKVQFLKPVHWLELRQVYLARKNMYLQRNDPSHSSFVVYIESVNEVYHKYSFLSL